MSNSKAYATYFPHTGPHCPRCGIDSIRAGVCTDPSCAWPQVSRA